MCPFLIHQASIANLSDILKCAFSFGWVVLSLLHISVMVYLEEIGSINKLNVPTMNSLRALRPGMSATSVTISYS